ncbi:MAG: MYG1 family protein [Simkaniaceae bacterium]|nr:MYG1 family protein [Simkaniaceae bacterium]
MQLLGSVGTHDGHFHADEITACSLLIVFDLVRPDQIIRSRNLEELALCEFVCDVGGIYDPALKRFDHHQESYRGNLSSAGMVLKYLKDEEVISEEVYHYLNDTFVTGVDLHDNGLSSPEIGHLSFSGIIHTFNPIEHVSDVKPYFLSALTFTIDLIRRLMKKHEHIAMCRADVKKGMEGQTKLLVYSQSMPWMDTFFSSGGELHPAEFLIMPSGENEWKLRGIPPTRDDLMAVRKKHPAAWAGKKGEELEKITGIPGAIFCHKQRFISIWKTKEAALKGYALMEKEQEIE